MTLTSSFINKFFTFFLPRGHIHLVFRAEVLTLKKKKLPNIYVLKHFVYKPSYGMLSANITVFLAAWAKNSHKNN